ncbi:MAG: hypothetical protein ACRC62_37765 [Microcoleus sp.]
MADPFPKKVRQYFVNLWKSLQGEAKEPPMQGNFRSHSRLWGTEKTNSGRNYDLEIHEFPIRDETGKARELIELVEWCPEVNFAIETQTQDCLSSADGDDQGIIINEKIREGKEVDPEVFVIGMDLIDRLLHYNELSIIIERMLTWGDCFLELGIDINERAITKTQALPTFEMFRCESQTPVPVEFPGITLLLNKWFEQRRSWEGRDAIPFLPMQIVHFRYRRKNLYGRSVFGASLEDWARLREATEDLAKASRELGINPTWHRMKPDANDAYRERFRNNLETQLQEGAVANYYLLPGEEMGKVGQSNPDLKPLVDTILMWRSRIVMASGVASYLFTGLPTTGAKDISGQPALASARRVNAIRAQVTEGIKQIIDTELTLKGIPKERQKYTIGWPKISVSQFEENAANVAEGDNEDTEKDAAGKKLERLLHEF